jgi:Lipase maturation factor
LFFSVSFIDRFTPKYGYWLTRFIILRLLGLVYAVAFLAAALQLRALIGSNGLTPTSLFVERLGSQFGSTWECFLRVPSLFWWNYSDDALVATAWIGFALSIIVLAGWANSIILAVLWFLYMSIVHFGQDWYAYGWESQLLETGFLAIFLVPFLDPRPFPRVAPATPIIWLFRWLVFRLMIGAGLIKLRGDTAWRDLTALYYHFETQPIPNALSRYFHFLPHPLLKAGVFCNHLAELVAPWFAFWPRIARTIAGIIMILFQLTLILSGNLSFLNWLSIIPMLACFDDSVLSRVLPRQLVQWAEKAKAETKPSRVHIVKSWVVAGLIAVLSVAPVANLVSERQLMNTSFDAWELVNSYGAFGSVGRERFTLVFEGTTDSDPSAITTQWREYLYPAQPVLLGETPVQIAPYQPRLDWAIWFAAMASPNEYPWTIHVLWKLLHNDPGTLSLFRSNPFPEGPPKYVRVMLYRYHFVRPGTADGNCWTRDSLGLWLPALSADDPRLTEFLSACGWDDYTK